MGLGWDGQECGKHKRERDKGVTHGRHIDAYLFCLINKECQSEVQSSKVLPTNKHELGQSKKKPNIIIDLTVTKSRSEQWKAVIRREVYNGKLRRNAKFAILQ
jgi:hypothetical protein